jgi:hypothetical protein
MASLLGLTDADRNAKLCIIAISGTGYFFLDSRTSVWENSSMARFAHVIVPGFPHHGAHGGNRRGDVFLEEGDRETYCGFLSDCAAKAS